jgi:hypothetical protein
MRARDFILENEEYVLYKDGQPLSKSSDEAQVLLDYNSIKSKFPNSSFEIRKTVCKPTPFKKLQEDDSKSFLNQYIPWVAKELGLKDLPKIVFLDQPNDTTFGTYSPAEKTISVVVGSRHPVDIMRTLTHELVHYKQDSEGRLKDGAGATGTPEENEANAEAGVVMRNFNQSNPEHLQQ